MGLNTRTSHICEYNINNFSSLEANLATQDTQRLATPTLGFDFDPWHEKPVDILESVYRGLTLQRAACVPTHRANIYGAIQERACIGLKGVYLLEIDSPTHSVAIKQQGHKKGYESLTKNQKQIGVFYRDSWDDGSDAGPAYLLVLQEEPLFPLIRHDFQTHQQGQMLDTVMGIVVVRDKGPSRAFRRLGLGRWVDEELLGRCKPQDVELI